MKRWMSWALAATLALCLMVAPMASAQVDRGDRDTAVRSWGEELVDWMIAIFAGDGDEGDGQGTAPEGGGGTDAEWDPDG